MPVTITFPTMFSFPDTDNVVAIFVALIFAVMIFAVPVTFRLFRTFTFPLALIFDTASNEFTSSVLIATVPKFVVPVIVKFPRTFTF